MNVRYRTPRGSAGSWPGPGLRTALAVVLLGLAGRGCSCGDTVSKLTIHLGATPKSIDFGTVALGATGKRTLELEATGTGPVTVQSITVTGAGKAAFVAPAVPASPTLAAATKVPVVVGFAPPSVGSFSATLVVTSTDKAGPISVPLTGVGKAAHIALCHPPATTGGTPDCAPAGTCLAVDLGNVVPAATSSADVLVRNVGEAKLDVVSVTPDAAATAAGVTLGADLAGTQVVVGGGVTLPVSLTGDGQGAVDGKIAVESNDPDQPSACIEVTATAPPNQPPTACAAATSVRHPDTSTDTPADPANPEAAPGDRVYLTAHPTPTCSADPEGGALTYAWQVTSKPSLSGASVTNPTSGPAPGSSEQPPWIDVDAVGSYTVSLVVTDPAGAGSQPATVTVNALPSDDLTIELSWHVPADLDLHLLAPGGTIFCQTLDCFWQTCRSQSPGVPVLDWGPDTTGDGKLDPDGQRNDDPILVFDNLGSSIVTGTADVRLETIRVPVAATVPGTPYQVGVHYFADRGVTDPTFDAEVKVVYRGQVILDTTRTFGKGEVGTFWLAGQLDVTNGTGTPLTAVSSQPTVPNPLPTCQP